MKHNARTCTETQHAHASTSVSLDQDQRPALPISAVSRAENRGWPCHITTPSNINAASALMRWLLRPPDAALTLLPLQLGHLSCRLPAAPAGALVMSTTSHSMDLELRCLLHTHWLRLSQHTNAPWAPTANMLVLHPPFPRTLSMCN